MKKNVLVLGARGMAGSMIGRLLVADGAFKVCGTTTQLNEGAYFNALGDIPEGLDSLWQRWGPFDYVINAIALTADQIDEDKEEIVAQAIKLNALFPHALAHWAGEHKASVIHISSDAVFSGNKDGYVEDDAPDCTDVYGKTKSLGEVHLPHFLNLRCSIIGPSPIHHRGLMEWFLSHSAGDSVAGYTNVFWNGITTYQLAVAILDIIKPGRFEALRQASSVYHLAAGAQVSKYELLMMMADVFGHRVTVLPAVSPRGDLRRILASRYQGLGALVSPPGSLREALEELKPWVLKQAGIVNL